MCKSFAEMKRNSGIINGDLLKALEKTKSFESEDDQFWKLTIDKSGVGAALIRFLPACEGEDLPFVKLYNHSFQNPNNGSWYFENCPTTIGKECPVCKHNSELWNTGLESDKTTVRNQKRKVSYISNILVINDPVNPDNNGKVFKYKYGKSIFDMIQAVMMPEPDPFGDTKEPLNPFDFWTGANFKLRTSKIDGYIKYVQSEFVSPSPISDSDEKIEQIWRQEYKLQEYVSESQFKSYSDLERKLQTVLGKTTTYTQPVQQNNVHVGQVVETKVDTDNVNDDLKYLESLVSNVDDDISF